MDNWSIRSMREKQKQSKTKNEYKKDSVVNDPPAVNEPEKNDVFRNVLSQLRMVLIDE